jgi:hypothetical protein
MPRNKKPRGRPPTTHRLPPKADATPEELAKAFFRWKPGDAVDFPAEYRCAGCQRVVEFPDVLYRDKRCADCTQAKHT